MALVGMSTTIEPYRRGISFAEWVERLDFFFQANGIQENLRRPHFITLGGPVVYKELKLLYPNSSINDVPYEDMIARLKSRLDKTESDLIQRFKFNNRVQQPDESVEDFVLSVKLQAEFCSFGSFKDLAIRDRIVAGVRDAALQQRLLNEENLTLAVAEKLVTTWEMAGANAKTLGVTANGGYALNKLLNTYAVANQNLGQVSSVRGPVKNRLGIRPYNGGNFNGRREDNDKRLGEWKRRQDRRRTDYSGYTCDFCGAKGHIKRKCFRLINLRRDAVNLVQSHKPGPSTEAPLNDLMSRMTTNDVDSDDDDDDNESGELSCMLVSSLNKISEPCLIDVVIEGNSITMEIDCGSAVSVMSQAQYFSHFDKPLQCCTKQLIVVNGSKLKIEGEVKVKVKYQGREEYLKLLVLNGDNSFIPLLGRPWLDKFFPSWRQYFSKLSTVNKVTEYDKAKMVSEIKQKYSNVFTKDFSSPIVGFEADLVLKQDSPIFRRAYNVPYRLRDRVSQYLEKLEKQKVITPIKTSEWASPVVVVMKKNDGIRLVIDCKVSINKQIIPNTYPLPSAQDIFAGLSGSKVFCSLDLEGAYTQLELSERSKKFMIINTIKGLYMYHRLPQGASSSASIFQQVMEQVLKDIDYVYVYLDDVLIAGKDLDDCRRKLDLVLFRLSEANIKVNLDKCKFFETSLIFLGHVISEKGLSPCSDKIETIQKAKVPENVTELKSFLGLVNYYNKFIPRLSSNLYCLYNLLKKDVQYVWDENCNNAFEKSKKALLRADLLEFYDPDKDIVVVSDASGYGLGGVIAHIIDGAEKPISFTSFSLNNAQKSYPILHLEALALVCTVKKFHKYLYGKKFLVFTDHKPLVGIFGKAGKNSILVTRIQRYILELSIYEFEIQYRPSERMGNADFCSRFPLKRDVPQEYDSAYIHSINFSKELPLDFKVIAHNTVNDAFLKEVIGFMQNGWPKRLDKRFADVFSNQHELEIAEGCLLYRERVVVPQQMHSDILKLLHANHSGMVKMKQQARRYVYWFGINSDIEHFVANCDICSCSAIVPKTKTNSAWIPTTRPFSRIHIDFFYLNHHTFLLMVDSFSKWLEIEWMKKGTECTQVLLKLVELFSRFGLPDVLVSDGGPPFNSHNFKYFLEKQGIKVLKSPPYHPSSNGQAERLVKTTKEVLKKFLLDPNLSELRLEDQINLFLFNYRNTPSKEGRLPSEMVLSYVPKTLIDLINPKKNHKSFLSAPPPIDDHYSINKKVKLRSLEVLDELTEGDEVWYRNNNPNAPTRWLKSTFLKKFSKNIFQITTGNVQVMAHRDQLRVSNRTRHLKQSNVFMSMRGESSAPMGESHVEDDRGELPDISSRRKRKRRQDSCSEDALVEQPRRSKRMRKPNRNSDYIYGK